jgi:predicted ATP-grasp superfamily ATP-dependent carboligase
MFAEDTDYGFVFQSEEMDNYDEVKTQFTNTDNKLTLELSEDGRVLTATFDTYTVELPETVVPKGISIRQIMYAVNECDTVEKLRQAYIQLANDYNKFRGECIDRE